MHFALAIGFVFLVLIAVLGVVDESGIAMLQREQRERASQQAQAKREADASAHAATLPKSAPVLTEAATKAFHAATPAQRGAYFVAIRNNDLAAANAAGAVLGLSPEYIAHEMESDAAKGLRQAAAEQQAAGIKERKEKLVATGSMTDAQAQWAASMDLPKSTRGGAPEPETLGERLARSGSLTRGEAAFAESLELPQS